MKTLLIAGILSVASLFKVIHINFNFTSESGCNYKVTAVMETNAQGQITSGWGSITQSCPSGGRPRQIWFNIQSGTAYARITAEDITDYNPDDFDFPDGHLLASLLNENSPRE